jgi:hypothetical protein
VHQFALNPFFVSSVLFTDEAAFTRNRIITFHNNRVWAEENPHAVVQSRHQQQFSINMWAGIIGGFGRPSCFATKLTGNSYRHFLENDLPTILEDLPLVIRAHMWFMHDGAPPHFSITIREFLDNVYPARWIARGGPTALPPRSPDLNPVDFHLRGHLQTLVYATPVNDIATLRQRVESGCQTIRNTPGIF